MLVFFFLDTLELYFEWNMSEENSVWRKDSFIFVLQILATETAIERRSNNSSILQKAVLGSNCCAILILPYH